MTEFIYNPPPGAPAILHQDDDLLFVDKPAGLLSVPGRGDTLSDCLIERLRVVFPDVLLVHRLDLDTSGVVVFALNAAAQGALGQQFEARKTRKHYVARVWGQVTENAGRVDLPLIVDWPNRPRQMVCPQTGKPAQTDWKLIRHEDGNTCRLRLTPITGRTHQLRMHMQAMGYPILGDTLYASGAALEFPRLMLHAQSLRLNHPRTGHGMTISTPVPF
jgi:tRNA pseudouridine32 synthase/23S rRNA pseudouridine746 synthase